MRENRVDLIIDYESQTGYTTEPYSSLFLVRVLQRAVDYFDDPRRCYSPPFPLPGPVAFQGEFTPSQQRIREKVLEERKLLSTPERFGGKL